MAPSKRTGATSPTRSIKSILPAKSMLDQSTSRILPLKVPQGKVRGVKGGFGSGEFTAEDLEYVPFQARTLIKPEDQLVLVADVLKEDIPRMLSTRNPNVPSNLVEYSFVEQCYMPCKPPAPAVLLFSYEGCVLHKDSDEAQLQMLSGPLPEEPIRAVAKKRASIDDDEGEGEAKEEENPLIEVEEPQEQEEVEEKAAEENVEEGGEEREGEEGEEKAEGEKEALSVVVEEEPPLEVNLFALPKKVKNQFNFCERAAMSYNNPFRDIQCQTVPACKENFSDQIMQWIIFDTYQVDFDTQQKLKDSEKEDYSAMGKHGHEHVKTMTYKEEMRLKEEKALELTKRTLLAAKTIERMICQNIYDEIAQDFRYWDDPADNWCEEGTLLPLWKFKFEDTKRQTITSICWNPCYFDFFAASFSYYTFSKLYTKGAVCLFSLKNPSYPEYTMYRETGIMSVDIHPKYPNLLVLGMTDGNVAVFNVNHSCTEAQTESSTASGKHGGIVWQVKWAPDTDDEEINFYSVSSDGLIYNWIIMYDRLEKTIILPLALPEAPLPEPDGTIIYRSRCGSAITFHPTDPLTFIAGTEGGPIYQCSTLYSSVPRIMYYGHTMPVARLDYNTYYPQIFLSCSGDWRIMIWEDGRAEPLFRFDLGCPVGDVEWAPFSSTLFAAVTLDGRVCVYDLNINKYEPICTQFVVSKRKYCLTRIAFNHKFPFIAVGDDKGCITTLKLSPNLRKPVKPPKKGPQFTTRELEIMKLEKILKNVLEPVELELPPSEFDMPLYLNAN